MMPQYSRSDLDSSKWNGIAQDDLHEETVHTFACVTFNRHTIYQVFSEPPSASVR